VDSLSAIDEDSDEEDGGSEEQDRQSDTAPLMRAHVNVENRRRSSFGLLMSDHQRLLLESSTPSTPSPKQSENFEPREVINPRNRTAERLEQGGEKMETTPQRRHSADDARHQFNMFTWVRETLFADKKSIRASAGADGVLLVGLVYRLFILFTVFTVIVGAPLGAMYATYDWFATVTGEPKYDANMDKTWPVPVTRFGKQQPAWITNSTRLSDGRINKWAGFPDEDRQGNVTAVPPSESAYYTISLFQPLPKQEPPQENDSSSDSSDSSDDDHVDWDKTEEIRLLREDFLGPNWFMLQEQEDSKTGEEIPKAVVVSPWAPTNLTDTDSPYEGWTVWQINGVEVKDDLMTIQEHWSDYYNTIWRPSYKEQYPVQIWVHQFPPGWIDYISLTNVPFDTATVAASEDASVRFYIIAVIVWFIVFGVLWLIRSMMKLMKKERRRYLTKLCWPDAYALIYQNLPIRKATQRDVEQYIEVLFPGRWRDVHICRELGHGNIRRMFQDYKMAMKTYKQALVDANMDASAPPEDLYVYKPSVKSFIRERFHRHSKKRQNSKTSQSSRTNSKTSQSDASQPASSDSDDDDAPSPLELSMQSEVSLCDQQERHIERSDNLNDVEKAALRVVRLKKKMKKEWDAKNLRASLDEPVDHPSIIVTFKSRIDKICASDAILEFKSNKPRVWNAFAPNDVRYWDLAYHKRRNRTQWIAYSLIVGIFFAFVPFVIFLGNVTKPEKVETAFSFLKRWKEAGGLRALMVNVIETYVPPLLLTICASVMAICFVFIGNLLVPFPSGTRLNLWACRIYFWFNMIFVVFGVMAVKIFWDIEQKPLEFENF